ncbi:5-(carboxyamino)imidazole ribonucleotide synthase [Hasllibacter halocynthiae]|uniref:N5-carboxyaminoimidazole ribonucleotide synthase n=1 Tax=Hasllibacter halocynthiae TaxID=595589 RepID=A0A2T0X0X9_9RHOB|nr:5-(carboxyamino)imidazole ribonucleotide synthase [Hasllibacter halocynthiae]PRY92591.1 5-(carboxyamino)imidazole ribonucleotide synthase [Hasllibacter halocynthiae]
MLPSGSTIGILGGGQLGRMLALAAARLGLRVRIYDPDPRAPAGDVAFHDPARWDDADALRRFARACDAITYEWENVPPRALDVVEEVHALRPSRRAIDVSADRLSEKTFLNEIGLATAPFAPVGDAASLEAGMAAVGTPAILKTRRLGYDGKGQVAVNAPADAGPALAKMSGAPAILEARIDFSSEISVIAARGADGATAAFDPGLNVHEDGILRTTTVPAPVPASVRQDAVLLAARMLDALDYVGVLGVEFFVTPGAGLIVNEIAPRVHNSGHWTQAGCAVDQFEQHVRAVAGWPLGDGRRHADVVMENLLGDEVLRAEALANEPGVQLHLYGKAEPRPGRKMGHVNRVTNRA